MFHVKLSLDLPFMFHVKQFKFTLKAETNTNYAMFHVKHGVIIYFFGING